MPEEDIRVSERETCYNGEKSVLKTFDSAVGTFSTTLDRASCISALQDLTLLGSKVGGPLGTIKDGKSNKRINVGLRDVSGIKSSSVSCKGPGWFAEPTEWLTTASIS